MQLVMAALVHPVQGDSEKRQDLDPLLVRPRAPIDSRGLLTSRLGQAQAHTLGPLKNQHFIDRRLD